ncbi:tetratricopeptide (TPR) repeat protein [Rhodovulum iodosum]|uniref:Tetratricopeptide (TPR) repeat protein n=1 Tax=Rhodovulum iodosum TaxID=68291 RepID=A0ABV3XP36_9RHOB|nr:tetratricopeptide repeat protein [Rhodovulum robiginosum]RSK41043.1 tetratricopeptide repeat protein [Rhodovulum robiginosum]
MKAIRKAINTVLAATLAGSVWLAPGAGSAAPVDELLEELGKSDLPNWKMVENEIRTAWSKSGSASMDLLLRRGREAAEAGDWDVAIAHFTALTDHAPGFAEGYNARALAYYKSNRYGPAIADLRRALALNPRHFEAMTGLATILEEIGREAEALEIYRAARAIHPHDPDLEKAEERLEQELSGRSL